MASIETGLTLPLVGHLYDHTGASFKRSFRLLNTPDLSLSINGQGASGITLELDAALSGGNAAPAKGDILTLTQEGRAAYAAAVLGDSPIAYWRLGELSGTVAVDSSGFGNVGTITGGVTLGKPGAIIGDPDTAMSFDGSTGYVSVPDSAQLNIHGSVPITLEAIFTPADVTVGVAYHYIVGKTATVNNYFAGYILAWDPSTRQFFLNLGSTSSGLFLSSGAALPVGQQYHVIAVSDGTTAHLIVNGQVRGTAAVPEAIASSSGRALGIGGQAGGTRMSAGTIDEVAVYSYALASDQWAEHYSALTANGSDGSTIFKGIVEDFPDERGSTNVHEILVNPVGVQLGDTPFTTNYSAATDIGQIARDIVSSCPNLSWDATSIPLTGTSAIFDFSGTQGYTCLSALDELRKIAGTNFYYWPDTSGKVWFLAANVAGPATHSIMIAPSTEARKYTAPVANRKNIVNGYGAVLAGATAPLVATYDNSAGSALGKRVLVPPLTYSQLTDLPTLQSIVNTIGSVLDREHVSVELELVNYPRRVRPGDVLRYFEEAVNERVESAGWPTTGAYSPNYVVLQVTQSGPRQSVVASDIPTTLDDLKYLIDGMISRTASGAVAAVIAGTGGVITPGMIGTALPSTPAAPTLATAIDQIAQANNARVTVSWLANPPGDKVSNYFVRWRQGTGPYHFEPAGGNSLTLAVHGLIPGTSYGFSVAAVNSLGNLSTYSTEALITTATDSAAPAVPTGLAAIKTPRGALVSWNPNAESDLQGYQLQVSIGGGAYSLVTPGPTLVTSLAYVAPSGTAQGTSLTFEVRSVDWSGNASAWSAASAAVNTDGIVFDELLAGNVKVFGTLTTGGLQTAASGARIVIDATGLRIYDGSATNYGAPSGAGVTAELKNDGAAFFKGAISASTVYGSTVATSAAVGTVGNAGFSLSGQFLDFFTIGATAEGGRYWYAPDSATIFTLVGQLAAGTITFPPGGADSVQESVSGVTVTYSTLATASFKRATTAALVKLGAVLVGSATSVSPLFGQATTAGHLLVAWVSANPNATANRITTTAPGWVKAVEAVTSTQSADAAIWYKPNCGAAETAPTFTITGGATPMAARLGEFSGIATASPVDSTGSNAQTTSDPSITATNALADSVTGDLILSCSRWATSAAPTFSDIGNNATPLDAGTGSDATNNRYAHFTYAIRANSPTGNVLQLTNFVGLEAITTDSSLARGLIVTQYSGDPSSAIFTGRKARGTQTAPNAIANGDIAATFGAQAYDGANWQTAGSAFFVVDGTVSAGVVPVDFVISPGIEAARFKSDKSTTLAGVLTVVGTGSSIASHITASGSAPGISGVIAGISGTPTIVGNDTHGVITFTVGAANIAANSVLFTVTFHAAYGAVPAILVGNMTSNAVYGGGTFSAGSPAAASFTVTNTATLGSGATIKLAYLVLGS